LCRLATGILDWVLMYLLVDQLHWNDLYVKIAVNILVILLNYVASKLLIFRKSG
ncbi:MAG: GtrA family protein, partial [Clostridia bacterium]|nr:GtrA family protein [Clostridia bacterium]